MSPVHFARITLLKWVSSFIKYLPTLMERRVLKKWGLFPRMCLPGSLRPLCKTRAVDNSAPPPSMVWVHLFNRRFMMKVLSRVANEIGASTE